MAGLGSKFEVGLIQLFVTFILFQMTLSMSYVHPLFHTKVASFAQRKNDAIIFFS
jgi:hypothetical protein